MKSPVSGQRRCPQAQPRHRTAGSIEGRPRFQGSFGSPLTWWGSKYRSLTNLEFQTGPVPQTRDRAIVFSPGSKFLMFTRNFVSNCSPREMRFSSISHRAVSSGEVRTEAMGHFLSISTRKHPLSRAFNCLPDRFTYFRWISVSMIWALVDWVMKYLAIKLDHYRKIKTTCNYS